MARTDALRKQHDELFQIVTDLKKNLNKDFLVQNNSAVVMELAKLSGKLKVHLSTEDKVLYPPLLASADAKVKSTADAFMKEMGGIGQVVESFFAKWTKGKAISEDAMGFIKETNDLFGALAKRIEKEHKDLYPLLDAAK